MAGAFDVALTTQHEPPAPWVEVADVAKTVDDLVARRINHAPTAAVTLCQVLQATTTVADGLVIELLVYSALQDGPEHTAWLAAQPPTQRAP